MLCKGVIEKSRSAWSSLIMLVPKPNGKCRFCKDFHKLNKVSKYDAYPMPRVDELIERLGPAQYISALDFTKGYWQVSLTPQAREKCSLPSSHLGYTGHLPRSNASWTRYSAHTDTTRYSQPGLAIPPRASRGRDGGAAQGRTDRQPTRSAGWAWRKPTTVEIYRKLF